MNGIGSMNAAIQGRIERSAGWVSHLLELIGWETEVKVRLEDSDRLCALVAQWLFENFKPPLTFICGVTHKKRRTARWCHHSHLRKEAIQSVAFSSGNRDAQPFNHHFRKAQVLVCWSSSNVNAWFTIIRAMTL